MTLFLTLYYYIIINNYSLNNYVLQIIIDYQLLYLINEEHTEIPETIIEIFDNLDEKSRDIIFDEIFKIIFNRNLLSKKQSNISFIDIINIENMFKIGYSGTVNINLKPFDYLEDKFNKIIPDNDEPINVFTAIMNAEIKYLDRSQFKKNIDKYFEIYCSKINLELYDSLIDLYGLFKNIKNINIAIGLNKKIGRNIIFIDEKDKEFIILINGEIEDYNPSKLYENPFLYFDQGHTVGVDIKQDKYPIMKGLCLVDIQSTYTDVAQAIFRLRKINLGHTIDLCLVYQEYKEYTIDDLYDLFILNDNKKKNESNDLLIYQTLKYQIRINKEGDIMKKHEEIIKYYYEENTEIPLDTELDKFFDGIFTKNELEYLKTDPNLNCLFYEIYDYDKLLKLIYNIGGSNAGITHSLQTELNSETSKSRENKRNIEIITKSKNNDSKIIYPKYEFIMYESILESMDNEKIFNLLTLHVDENIYCLPNIFTQTNGFDYKNNMSGLLFVYFDCKFLIIPGYMLSTFIDKYVIISFNQIILNPHILKIKKITKMEIINEMNILRLIKYTRMTIVFDETLSTIKSYIDINKPRNILLSLIIIKNNSESLSISQETSNKLSDEIKKIYDEWLSEKPLRKLLLIDDTYTMDNLHDKIQLFQNLGSNPNLYKYLKYKLKYYSLKN